MVRNLVVVLVIAGAGFWYWSNKGPDDRPSAEQQRLDDNASRMQRCIHREQSMNAAAGPGGVGGIVGDAKEICAEKLGLYFAEGHWQSLGLGNDYVRD